MKREFASHPRHERRSIEQRSGTCIALIDGRFLIWLAQQGAVGITGESVNRQGLLSLLSQALVHGTVASAGHHHAGQRGGRLKGQPGPHPPAIGIGVAEHAFHARP